MQECVRPIIPKPKILKLHRYKPRILKPNRLKVGGYRDEHGCIGSAGFVWNDDMQECVQPWKLK